VAYKRDILKAYNLDVDELRKKIVFPKKKEPGPML
jgi:hypothetical protein